MPALVRMVTAALTLVLAGSLAVTVDGAAGEASPSAAATVPATAAQGLDLGDDVVRPHWSRASAKVRKWQGTSLRYYETLPAKWDWSLRTAVAKWNAAGGRIRLVRVAVATKAQVRITYGNIGGAAGLATIGATRNAFVRLSNRFVSADGTTAHNRVTVMNVLAHELGHVLGFRHTTTRCTLMAPVLNLDACGVLPTAQPGYYTCATLDRALVQRFVRLYGGRATYPASATCLIDPLPPVLSGVSFTGGTTAPVTIRWKPPVSVPAGAGMVVRRWQSSLCSANVPSWADTFRPGVKAGLWQDGLATQDESACFTLRLVNRYGAGRAPLSQVLERWVPPVEAPTIGAPTYDADADAFTFPVTLAEGLVLQARWDSADPDTCLTTPAEATNVSYVPVTDGQGILAPDVLPQCVSFFAYDPESNRFSAPVPVTFTPVETPVPDAPGIDEATWDPARPAFLAPATYEEGTHLVYAMSDDPETCPGDYTTGQPVIEDEETIGEGIVAFMALAPDQCVSFYAVDDESGVASEPTQVVVHAPLPTETLAAEERLEPRAYPWWYARVTGLATGNHLGYHVFHGPCPTTVPDVVRWRTQLLGDLGPSSPEAAGDAVFPSQGVGTNCAMFTSLDWWGWQGSKVAPGSMTDRHGPVVMREFVDEGPLDPTVGTPVWMSSLGKFEVPVSFTGGVQASYDPSDPTTCPLPGAAGAQQVSLASPTSTSVVLTPPAAPYSCVTFYAEANDGPVRLSQGVPVDLDVPQG